PELIAGLAKGLAVIEVFDENAQKLTISQVAERVGLERATTRRCLLTLVKLGYAEYDGKFFSLTPRMLRLGYAYLSST
ncbi:helix-turn-helix domain-containing protein, partial [Citrobacter freundii]|uniref:helix-turn-helix domain-containing protein n=1 Tax=Citrobacter freundii TaxID=546 RepID=UPI0013D7AEDC